MIQYTTGAHNHDKEHDNCIIYMCVCIIRLLLRVCKKKNTERTHVEIEVLPFYYDFLNKRICFLFITPVFFFFFFFF